MTASRRTALPFTFVLGLPPQADAEPAPIHVPPVDVLEVEGGWRLVFEIPGADPARLMVEVKGRSITLRGERRATECAGGRFLRVERAAGPFERLVQLPDDPDPEKTSATYKDGLLIAEVGRMNPRRRTIAIKSGAKEPS